jgi:outer membrane lipoprotein-sorting protein
MDRMSPRPSPHRVRILTRAIVCVALLVVFPPHAGSQPVRGRLWADAVDRYDAVRDYTAIYEKEERAIDQGAKQRMRLFFRKPLDVRLEWLDDAGEVDQIAVYRHGYNDGKLLARRRGLLGGLLGTLRLDVNGARARADSRHAITDVGLGYIITRVADQTQRGEVAIRLAREEILDGVPCDRLEIASTTNAPLVAIPGARRGTAWIDRALALPVRIDISDQAGLLLERHRFLSVRLNVGLADEVFSL